MCHPGGTPTTLSSDMFDLASRRAPGNAGRRVARQHGE